KGDKNLHDGNLLTGSDIEDPVLFEEYDINKGLTEYLAANAQGFGEQDPEEMIREELSNPGGRIYVARVKGRIAASVTVWEIEPRIFATENIFTVPEYRGRHLAREILKKVLMTISVNGAKTARLSVFGDDFEALGLYYGLGFELKAEKYELRF
ncbi:MAG: GNAT family N-acetyltransferase, partial [Lachnospiraceae bacterium]|nr:GNAT family N-acetyltransferase [Lachnospiraceae bacterium]